MVNIYLRVKVCIKPHGLLIWMCKDNCGTVVYDIRQGQVRGAAARKALIQ